MDNLHNAMSKMDDSNNRRFIVWVDSFDSFADAMNAFASQTVGLRNDF